jgi:hypothetical protein
MKHLGPFYRIKKTLQIHSFEGFHFDIVKYHHGIGCWRFVPDLFRRDPCFILSDC